MDMIDRSEPSGPIHPVPEKAHGLAVARLQVAGMRCEGCATRIQQALASDRSILGVSASYGEGTVAVLFDTARLTLEAVCRLVLTVRTDAEARLTIRQAVQT